MKTVIATIARAVIALAGLAQAQSNEQECNDFQLTQPATTTICFVTLAGHTTYTLTKISNGSISVRQISSKEYNRLLDAENKAMQSETKRVNSLNVKNLAEDEAKLKALLGAPINNNELAYEKARRDIDADYLRQRIATEKDAIDGGTANTDEYKKQKTAVLLQALCDKYPGIQSCPAPTGTTKEGTK